MLNSNIFLTLLLEVNGNQQCRNTLIYSKIGLKIITHDKYLMKGKNLWYTLYFVTFSLPSSTSVEDSYFRGICDY